MKLADQVAGAANQREALILIANGIDALAETLATPAPAQDTWAGDWPSGTPATVTKLDDVRTESVTKLTLVSNATDDELVYQVPKVSEEIQGKRLALAIDNGLMDKTGKIDLATAYSTGGPEWLYVYDRDLVMGMPIPFRKEMVQELEDRGLIKEARDMANDILKDRGEQNMGNVAPTNEEY